MFVIFVIVSIYYHYKYRYTTYKKVLKEAEIKLKNAILKIELEGANEFTKISEFEDLIEMYNIKKARKEKLK